ncbi:hypothetical protein [Quadrisphaera setariae]|uniref:DUF2975 domain-containing protein n=1 Tax=Quadrisphaera setariae TaxID=2593304 RepID=A0A5C8Z3B8_9ACTN|nr:hypothetical protein [Quadrisphaera setariae]TXR52592.1 hypothetical protein FMM08_19355 [Quadrisphaera setariae]
MTTAAKQYARPWLLGLLEVVLGVAGLAAIVIAPVYWVNGMTQAGAGIDVPVVVVRSVDALDGSGGRPADVAVDLPVGTAFVSTGDVPPPQLSATNQDLELSSQGSTVAEWALVRGGVLLWWGAAGVAALLLRRVVTRVGEGRSFSGGNARCIAGSAVCVLVASQVAPVLPRWAAALVLERLGMAGAGASLSPSWQVLDVSSLLLVGLLLALAEAFRQGEKLVRDAEGPV